MPRNPDRHDHVRGLILRMLVIEYPKPIDTVLMRSALHDVGYTLDAEDLESYLAYLVEKGCAKVDRKKDFDIVHARATAKGVDVLDGRIEELGIGVRR